MKVSLRLTEWIAPARRRDLVVGEVADRVRLVVEGSRISLDAQDAAKLRDWLDAWLEDKPRG